MGKPSLAASNRCHPGSQNSDFFKEMAVATTVDKRGQTTIPAQLRKRYGIRAGSTLIWIDNGQGIQVVPVLDDPIAALQGSVKGERLLEKLLAERKQDRERER
jgi:AbrB family looped-hinge helix DNA binding protein